MPQKRSHNKSRRGCFTCRKRRVKCDESYPLCSNCERRGEECTWPERRQYMQPDSPPQPLMSSSQALSTHSPPPVSPVLADLTNTFLLHHYTVHTCLYGIRSPEILKMRQIQTPKVAFSNIFFLHTLLSHAALDLSLLYKDSDSAHDYIAISRSHLRLAWETAPEKSSNLPQTMAFGVRFVFASMHAFWSPTQEFQGWMPKTLIWLSHCRRLFSELMQVVPAPQLNSPLDNALKYVKDTAWTSQESGLHAQVSTLHLPWSTAPDPDEVKDETLSQIYMDALYKLQGAYSIATRDGHDVPALLAWAVHISPSFLQLVMERRPRAIVILAHFYVLVGQCRALHRLPDGDLSKIFAALDHPWRSWLATTMPTHLLEDPAVSMFLMEHASDPLEPASSMENSTVTPLNNEAVLSLYAMKQQQAVVHDVNPTVMRWYAPELPHASNLQTWSTTLS